MNEIKIEVIPSENKPKDKRLALLEFQGIKLPATSVIYGRCGSGKSSILYTLLTKGFVYGSKKKSIFDESIIWLGAQDAKHAFEKLPIKNKLILEEFEPDDFAVYIEDLRQHQMERLEKNKSPMNCLLVFDDFVGNALTARKKGKSSPVEKLALTSRHELNTSIFFCSQVFKNNGFGSPSVRNNITTTIISTMSRPEIEKMSEELSQDYHPQEWLAIYYNAMKTPYNFIVCDTRRPLDAQWTIKFHIPFPKAKGNFLLKTVRSKIEDDEESDTE